MRLPALDSSLIPKQELQWSKVIAAASSDDKLEMCKKVAQPSEQLPSAFQLRPVLCVQLGADYVVNYSKQKLKDAAATSL